MKMLLILLSMNLIFSANVTPTNDQYNNWVE